MLLSSLTTRLPRDNTLGCLEGRRPTVDREFWFAEHIFAQPFGARSSFNARLAVTPSQFA